MEEISKILNAVMYKLDSINIHGRITANAAAYNDIISCINSLSIADKNLKALMEKTETTEEPCAEVKEE